MTRIKYKTRPIRVFAVSTALSVAFWPVSASLKRLSAQDRKASGTMYPSKRMSDGKQWMTRNLDVKTMPSYCYEGAAQNCRRYGRLYTWESAPRACLSLGDGWRLPTDNEWRQMAKAYGGVSEDSEDKGKAAYKAARGRRQLGISGVARWRPLRGRPICAIGSPRILLDGIGDRFGERMVLQLRSRRAGSPPSKRW